MSDRWTTCSTNGCLRYSIVDHLMLILGADCLDRAQKEQAELVCKAAENGAGAGVLH